MPIVALSLLWWAGTSLLAPDAGRPEGTSVPPPQVDAPAASGTPPSRSDDDPDHGSSPERSHRGPSEDPERDATSVDPAIGPGPAPPVEPAPSSGGFFDPVRVDGSSGLGSAVQVHGFIAANIYYTERSNLRRRDSDGSIASLPAQVFFDLSSATLYFGAPIFGDLVYARVGLELVALPNRTAATTGRSDIIGPSQRALLLETAALEVLPFSMLRSAPQWVRSGFKITGGVFILPFGLEDAEHAAPVNWFSTRPAAMTVGRVYPGTWSDVGVALSWSPTFARGNSRRPIQVDVGVVNGDACTQTRFVDQLFSITGLVARCERRLRDDERDDGGADLPEARIDAIGPGFVLPDNNRAKSVVGRVRIRPVPALDLGGSFVWGRHPQGGATPDPGETTAELGQADSWRVGAHLDLDLDAAVPSKFPLPHVRGEFVYGRDDAVAGDPAHTDRRMMGGYAQIAQPLYRRKRSRLPGLTVQYRFDHADPDLAVPGVVDGVDLVSDVTSAVYLRETAQQSHTVGLRYPVVPQFTLKAEYSWILEDGGPDNQIDNDRFVFEAVADF